MGGHAFIGFFKRAGWPHHTLLCSVQSQGCTRHLAHANAVSASAGRQQPITFVRTCRRSCIASQCTGRARPAPSAGQRVRYLSRHSECRSLSRAFSLIQECHIRSCLRGSSNSAAHDVHIQLTALPMLMPLTSLQIPGSSVSAVVS